MAENITVGRSSQKNSNDNLKRLYASPTSTNKSKGTDLVDDGDISEGGVKGTQGGFLTSSVWQERFWKWATILLTVFIGGLFLWILSFTNDISRQIGGYEKEIQALRQMIDSLDKNTQRQIDFIREDNRNNTDPKSSSTIKEK